MKHNFHQVEIKKKKDVKRREKLFNIASVDNDETKLIRLL
jgi:hypothetical protein